jgi:hypothetical protein
MKKLTDFAKNTFHYVVHKRYGNLAIIKALTKSGGTVAYDVIHIREREETKLFDNVMPASEYAPGNEEFSTHGWSYPNEIMAEKKFQELIETDRFKTKEYIQCH